MAAQLRLLPSNKPGGRKMHFQGFSYTERSDTNISIFWVCSERVKFGCKGTLRTNKDLTNPQVYIICVYIVCIAYYYFCLKAQYVLLYVLCCIMSQVSFEKEG